MNILYKMVATRKHKRHRSKKNRKTRTRRMKKGGAGETMDFNNLAELKQFLSNPRNDCYDRVDIYTKDDYTNNKKSTKQYTKKDFSNLYEMDNVDKYVFIFY